MWICQILRARGSIRHCLLNRNVHSVATSAHCSACGGVQFPVITGRPELMVNPGEEEMAEAMGVVAFPVISLTCLVLIKHIQCFQKD